MKKLVQKTVNLDLEDCDGNAFAILGAFRRQARREEWTQEEIDLVLKVGQSSDYNHLLATIVFYCETDYKNED